MFDFRKPTRYKELKSFIGLCEYIHVYMRDFSAIMKPLHDLMQGYTTKGNRIRTVKWTKNGNLAFLLIQQAIFRVPSVSFCSK